jgi:hypothetical protein
MGVSEPAHAFLESTYIQALGRVRKPLMALLAKGGALDTRPGKDVAFGALVKALPEKFSAEEVEFYGRYVRDGVAATDGKPALQALFRRLLEEHADVRDSNGGRRAELLAILKRARELDAELVRRLERIVHLESLLAPAGALFDFVLTRNSQRPQELGRVLRSQWGKIVPNLDADTYQGIRDEIRTSASAEVENAAARCHTGMAAGDYEEAIRAILEWNQQVMIRRHAGPWASLGGNGRIDVRIPAVEYPIPTAKELPMLWRNSYFIDSLKSISQQLANRR